MLKYCKLKKGKSRLCVLFANMHMHMEKMEGKQENENNLLYWVIGITGFCECASVYTISTVFKCIHVW